MKVWSLKSVQPLPTDPLSEGKGNFEWVVE